LGTLRLWVYDKVTNAKVEGASCHIPWSPELVVTDATGVAWFFSVPEGEPFVIRVTHPLYESYMQEAIIGSGTYTYNIFLIPKAVPKPKTYTLTVQASAGGTTVPAAGTMSLTEGAVQGVMATPASGYSFVRWLVNGVDAGSANPIVITMDGDKTVQPVFEAAAAPPPAPPPPTKSYLQVSVKDVKGSPLANAKVTVSPIGEQYSNVQGLADFGEVTPGTYSCMVTLAGYESSSTSFTVAQGQAYTHAVTLGEAPAIDPWGALTGVLKGIWDLLLGALTAFTKPIQAGIKGQADQALAEATKALGPGSPDEETEEKAKKLAEELKKRQEEIIRRMYSSPVSPEKAPESAATLVTALLGTQLAVEVLATVGDNIHPIRSTRAIEIAQRINDALGIGSTVGAIAMMPTEIGLLPQLRYWYNSQFTPAIPGPTDLVNMLVKETITPEEFNQYIAMQGFSKAWADRYWDVHWRLPAPEAVTEAFHRGLITKAERDTYLVLHDYRPTARPGLSRADRDIVAGLQKNLITRIDLRRGWELGLISDEQLLKGYENLGYEDDAKIVAEIQKSMALENERNAIARPAGRSFRDGKISEADYRALLTKLDIRGERQDLWILRYLWERKNPPTTPTEQVEAGP